MNFPVHKLMIILSVAVLNACSIERADVEPEGRLAVLGPTSRFTTEKLPNDWVIESGHPNQLHVEIINGIPSLRITNATAEMIAVRRTRAMMMATPFLSWSWNMENHGPGIHPTRIIIGFYGGHPQSRDQDDPTDIKTSLWPNKRVPPHDRALSLAWGESALERGKLSAPKSIDLRTVPRYTVRGGRENTQKWWLETVDLSSIYTQLWPTDPFEDVRITFIGIAAEGGREPVSAHISGLLLSH